nr:MAG TPA: hypothetical protein [Caudoviricetes sp.]
MVKQPRVCISPRSSIYFLTFKILVPNRELNPFDTCLENHRPHNSFPRRQCMCRLNE